MIELSYGAALYAGAALMLVGVLLGQRAEARLWRERGDHEYMNTMESGGKLYLVRPDWEDPR